MQHSSIKAIPLSELLKKEKGSTKGVEFDKIPSDKFRPIVMQTGALDDRKGSAYVEFGCTKIVCTIDGPKEPTRNVDLEPMEGQIRVFLRDSTSIPSTSTGQNYLAVTKEVNGIRSVIESALRSVVCLDLFCRAQIDVEITILNDDGGVLAASLIAASLALIDSGIQVYDVCVAAHIVMLGDGRVIVDPSATINSSSSSSNDNSEDFPQNAHLSVTVALMPSLNQLACCECLGIASPDQLRRAIAAAVENSLKLYPLIRKTLTSR